MATPVTTRPQANPRSGSMSLPVNIRPRAGLHDSLVNARTAIKAQIAVNTVSNIQNSELKSMPLSCSGRSNGGGQGGIFRPSSFGSMTHLRCSGSHAGLWCDKRVDRRGFAAHQTAAAGNMAARLPS